MISKKYSTLFFLFFLLLISFYYDYHNILFKRPQSVHAWRQADCASIALNYYQDKLDFFHPQTHLLVSEKGQSGKCSTSEVPILYYSVASLYSAFGYHEFLYRLLTMLIFFLGLLYLFKLLYYLLKDFFWSACVGLLFFTSPVLVYYGNNFLTNVPALSFSIIAWFYLVRFYFEKKNSQFIISIILFLIAASFKITALYSVIALGALFGLEFIVQKTKKRNPYIFDFSYLKASMIVFIFLIIIIWTVYTDWFNRKNQCTYFSTTIFPIWSLDTQGIFKVLKSVKEIWLSQYFNYSLIFLCLLAFGFILINYKKCNKLLINSIILIFIGVLVYILLQFWTFQDHDYYVIESFILPILILTTFFDVIKRHYPKIINSLIVKITFIGLLCYNIYFAHSEINIRYNGWMSDTSKKELYNITPYLRQIGITEKDTVISIPDASPLSLYLMNQKGWTEYLETNFNRGKKFYYNRDSIGIQNSIDKGAKYLIINGIDNLYSKPYLQHYCKSLKGRFQNVIIFDLTSESKNFNISERIPEIFMKCSAELVDKEKGLFYSENSDSLFFENGITQSSDFSHSGKSSSKLNIDFPYGMTLKLKDLKAGESFRITVWRKSTDKTSAGIIASSNNFYSNAYNIVENDSNNWVKLQAELFINHELENQELVLYLYNPNPEPVYFDDFEVLKYKSIY